MQTSFIPKKPITETSSSGSGVSLFLLISIILFIVAIAASGGVWVWQKQLNNNIEASKLSLEDTKKNYEEKTIKDLIRLDDRIEQTKILLAKHLAVTPVFTMLQKNIIQNVQLKSMKFSYGGNGKTKIELTGVAKNYDALSKQSDAFGSDNLKSYVSQPVVSDFLLNADGTVSFNFSALIDPSLISYSNSIGGVVNTSGSMGTTTNQ